MKLVAKGFKKAISQLNSYTNNLTRRCELLVAKLAEQGLQVASVKFAAASYDGTNDVVVHVEQNGTKATIVAEGKAVAFVEFGTGLTSEYPGEAAAPYPHGSYGKGQGARGSWIYYGEPGTNGRPVTKKNGTVVPGLFVSSGNPPAMAMWDALSEMASRVQTAWLEAMRD